MGGGQVYTWVKVDYSASRPHKQCASVRTVQRVWKGESISAAVIRKITWKEKREGNNDTIEMVSKNMSK